MGLDASSLPDRLRLAMHRAPALRPAHANNHHANHPRPVAQPKRPAGNEPLEADQAQEGDSPRILLRYVSVRKRLCDEDNLVSKFHTDLLRYAKLIPEDSPGVCKIETAQRKVRKGEEEHVQITLIFP